MKGFYHIWAWRPSWSCDLDFLYIHWFPLPIDASYKIWLWLVKRFQRRRSLKLWTDGRTTDGRTPDHGHPISSPCEPNGSGELINMCEYYGAGADEALGAIFFFQNNQYSVHLPISCWFSPSNDTLIVFPIQMHRQPMLTLP